MLWIWISLNVFSFCTSNILKMIQILREEKKIPINNDTHYFSKPGQWPTIGDNNSRRKHRLYTLWRKWTVSSKLPARMSVIKLFLARNMIFFCGLNKILCQPGVLQGFLRTRLMYLFPGRNFPRNSTSPARNLKKSYMYLFPDRSFPGIFPFPA